MRDSLPVVPVPLKSPDPDIRLGLGQALSDAVAPGDYDETINYREEPPPPAFSVEDRAWLQNVLRERNLIP